MIDPQASTGGDAHPPQPASRVLPAEDVFLETPAAPVLLPPLAVAHSPATRPLRIGPGICEAIGWMFGMHVIQTMAFFAGSAILAIAFLTSIDGDALQQRLASLSDPVELVSVSEAFFAEHLIFLAAMTQAATLVFAVAAIRLRLGRKAVSRLGWQPPAAGHCLLVVLMMVPLQLVCGELQHQLSNLMPGPAQQFAETMQELAKAPLPLLILLIAVAPAFAEELLFRGLIGRGLVARRGLVRGVLITSLLFGVVHVNPGQAIAVIPIGIALHFVYLTTRSFWAPVTLHFLNNAFAAVALKMGEDFPLAQLIEGDVAVPLPVLTASVATITAIGLLLWQTRVQFVLADGSAWSAGYADSDMPPSELGAIAVRQNPRLLLLAGSTLNSLGFFAVLKLAMA